MKFHTERSIGVCLENTCREYRMGIPFRKSADSPFGRLGENKKGNQTLRKCEKVSTRRKSKSLRGQRRVQKKESTFYRWPDFQGRGMARLSWNPKRTNEHPRINALAARSTRPCLTNRHARFKYTSALLDTSKRRAIREPRETKPHMRSSDGWHPPCPSTTDLFAKNRSVEERCSGTRKWLRLAPS